MENAYICAICGERHEGLAMAFGSDAPEQWRRASDELRAEGELTADQCILPLGDGGTGGDGGVGWFIRGQIELNVADVDGELFCWSVWVSLSKQNWMLQSEHWDDPEREKLNPMFAWLDTDLPGYETTTVALPARLHTREPGMAPLIEIGSGSDHPLAREQQNGITLHRIAELNNLIRG